MAKIMLPKLDMADFCQFMRPIEFRQMLDKRAGITPEQRTKMDEEKRLEEQRVDAIATRALEKLTQEEAEALEAYFTRDM